MYSCVPINSGVAIGPMRSCLSFVARMPIFFPSCSCKSVAWHLHWLTKREKKLCSRHPSVSRDHGNVVWIEDLEQRLVWLRKLQIFLPCLIGHLTVRLHPLFGALVFEVTWFCCGYQKLKTVSLALNWQTECCNAVIFKKIRMWVFLT